MNKTRYMICHLRTGTTPIDQKQGRGRKCAHLGPVQPIVVPSPPLSLRTTSLSSSFFVASRSASNQHDPISVHTQSLQHPRLDPQPTYADQIGASDRTFGRGREGVVGHHHLIGRGLDLAPLDLLRLSAAKGHHTA